MGYHGSFVVRACKNDALQNATQVANVSEVTTICDVSWECVGRTSGISTTAFFSQDGLSLFSDWN